VARLRIGTCSWKYPSWDGLVYSAPKGINYLQEYSRHYDTVEIDQWFWSLFGQDSISLPRLETVQEYVDSVQEDFQFTVKVPNSVTLTHFYKKKKSDPLLVNPHFLSPSLFGAFLSALEPMQPQLGPLMFQFEYLIPAGYQVGLELRNGRWLNENWFRFLLAHHLDLVFLQGYWMPDISELYAQHRELIHEFPSVVVRLHGPDRKGIEKLAGGRWDKIVAPKDDELAAVAEMVEEMVTQGIDVHLNVNNHYEGSAPETIDRIRALFKSAALGRPIGLEQS